MRAIAASILGLGLLIPAAAFAGTSAGQNPVVNVSGLAEPGLWQTTTVNTINGKAQKPDTDTACVSAEDLRDFLNQKDSLDMQIEEYSLKGNHFHVKAKGKSMPMQLREDIYFDSRDRMHGTVEMTRTAKPTMTMTSKITSHRVSAACPAGGGNDNGS